MIPKKNIASFIFLIETIANKSNEKHEEKKSWQK